MFFLTFDYWFWMSIAIASTALFAFTASLLRSRLDSMRGLFLYFDGKLLRGISPLKVLQRLDAIEAAGRFRLYYDPQRAAVGDARALATVGKAVREVFEVPAFTSPHKAGLTDEQCRTLLMDFVRYADFRKRTEFATAPTLS